MCDVCMVVFNNWSALIFNFEFPSKKKKKK